MELTLTGPATSRGFLELEGQDACKLLQGLITNDTTRTSVKSPEASLHAAFLTAKGRIISDTIIHVSAHAKESPGGPDKLIVDVPIELKDAIQRHLKMHKLRSKVDITDITASSYLRIGLLYGLEEAKRKWADPISLSQDPRTLGLGIRAVLPLGGDSIEADNSEGMHLYEALRILHGIPEGHDLVERLPSECNFDLTNGISFTKGCYLGQELTARTHFKGVVRKRLLPFYSQSASSDPAGTFQRRILPSLQDLLSNASPTPVQLLSAPFLHFGTVGEEVGPTKGSDILDEISGKKVGSVLSRAEGSNLGLALVRLEEILQRPMQLTSTIADTESSIRSTKFNLQLFTPSWWPAIDVRTGKV